MGRDAELRAALKRRDTVERLTENARLGEDLQLPCLLDQDLEDLSRLARERKEKKTLEGKRSEKKSSRPIIEQIEEDNDWGKTVQISGDDFGSAHSDDFSPQGDDRINDTQYGSANTHNRTNEGPFQHVEASTQTSQTTKFAPVHLVVGIFLILCGAVNLNDPDPIYWVSLYGFGAAMNLIAFFNALGYFPAVPVTIPSLFGIMSLAGLARLGRAIETPASIWEFFETEEGREIGGLFILGLDMILLVLTSGKNAQQPGRLVPVLYWSLFVLVLAALYAAVFLQPAMNRRLKVEHCNGILHRDIL
eukprot:TRINITY_DN1531_c0_g1_i1.p1 TRINITY_DN1531_c0_g1~~TRINITY_DN1531_c0_g1_i1.p1  ORF type:complete len:338 (+),score=33.80 TRINITY_DN1531_c0_g1_i1:100-1014(+)